MIIDSLKEAPAPFSGTEIYTLPNGYRFILKEDRSVPGVSIQAWARCGAVDEQPNIYGISHGLEHMVFKGTHTKSAGEITRAIESQGGAINAATQLETTHYYVEVPSYGTDVALDVLADTLLHPTFPEEELERERKVILEEIHRRDDSPEATLWDEFIPTVFPDSPYAIKVIGNEKSVSSLSRDDLNSYYRKYYVPSNLCFVVVGNIEKSKILTRLKNHFEGLKPEKAPEAPPVKILDWKPKTIRVKKPVQLSYIAMGCPVGGLLDRDVVTLDLLADILGGGISSRIYQRLREDLQVVLSVSCDYIAFRQKGLFSFFLDALPNKSNEAIKKLVQECRNLKDNPIKPEELSRAKARTKSDWLMGSETPRGQASTLGSLSVLGASELVTHYLPRVEAVKVDDLMNLAKRFLFDPQFSITVLEPDKS